MRRLAVLFPILVLLGMAALPGLTVPAAATTAVCPPNPSPPNPSPPNPADPSMVLNEPVAGATVTSPVRISGLARVFEAHVSIVIYGASGMELVQTSTLASEAGPTLAPFATDVPFTVLVDQPGCIRVYEPSAMDGSPRNVVQVEVNLKAPAVASPTAVPTATPGPVTPPSTGDAGLAEERPQTLAPIVIAGVLLTAAVCVRLRRGGIRE